MNENEQATTLIARVSDVSASGCCWTVVLRDLGATLPDEPLAVAVVDEVAGDAVIAGLAVQPGADRAVLVPRLLAAMADRARARGLRRVVVEL